MNDEIISGTIIEQEVTLSVRELAQACAVPQDFVIRLVDADILEPIELETEQWSFSGNCLTRVRISYRLQRDLEVNLPGIAIILDLLESRGI